MGLPDLEAALEELRVLSLGELAVRLAVRCVNHMITLSAFSYTENYDLPRSEESCAKECIV